MKTHKPYSLAWWLEQYSRAIGRALGAYTVGGQASPTYIRYNELLQYIEQRIDKNFTRKK